MPPGFWLVPSQSLQLNILGAYPPQIWDPRTQVMQPQPEFGIKEYSTKIGAILLHVDSKEILLVFGTFGLVYPETTPWCEIRDSPIQYDLLDSQSDGVQSVSSYLKHHFDSFRLKGMTSSTMPKPPTAVYRSPYRKDLDLGSSIQRMTVLGRDMYLIKVYRGPNETP
jgi:hypothetical protein